MEFLDLSLILALSLSLSLNPSRKFEYELSNVYFILKIIFALLCE